MDLSNDPTSAGVLYVAPECAPLVKTGGLGDVCGALPAALRAAGNDVRVLVPGYREVLAQAPGEAVARISALGIEARLLRSALPGSGVPLLVLDCPALFARPGGPYQDTSGQDWPDNALRFGFLCAVAALLAGPRSPLAWRPQVLHCNDWQSALAPVFIAEEKAAAKTVLTIHNLAFQGNFDPSILAALRLPSDAFTVEKLEFYGKASFLKGGIVHADALTTVSPTYAREIQTEAFGCGMDGLLRRRSDALTGVLNGIDTSVWDPAIDQSLVAGYSMKDISGKKKNKKELQKRMGLAIDDGVPLFGTVGRMTHQKGTDLIVAAAAALVEMGQLAILGSGDRTLEAVAKDLEKRYPGRVSVRIGFSEELAHLVEAGADAFLMPSRFEPCGLNQMYSQRYGPPPLARATRGLADTIADGVTGFLFEEARPEALAGAAKRAVAAYRQRAAWQAMQRAGLARDLSLTAAAPPYSGP